MWPSEEGKGHSRSHGVQSWGAVMGCSHGVRSWGAVMGCSHGVQSWGAVMGWGHGVQSWGAVMGCATYSRNLGGPGPPHIPQRVCGREVLFETLATSCNIIPKPEDCHIAPIRVAKLNLSHWTGSLSSWPRSGGRAECRCPRTAGIW